MIYFYVLCALGIAYLLLEELVNMWWSLAARRWPVCNGRISDWSMRTEADSEDSNFYVDKFEYKYVKELGIISIRTGEQSHTELIDSLNIAEKIKK